MADRLPAPPQHREPPGEDLIPPPDCFFRNTESKSVITAAGKRYSSLGEWQAASGQEQHSIFKDPGYADPERWDFRLSPGSPNLGAGENGATMGALGPAP